MEIVTVTWTACAAIAMTLGVVCGVVWLIERRDFRDDEWVLGEGRFSQSQRASQEACRGNSSFNSTRPPSHTPAPATCAPHSTPRATCGPHVAKKWGQRRGEPKRTPPLMVWAWTP